MLDLTTSSLLVETKYAARKSTTPILSITKVGSAFNVAFCETYILPGKNYKKNATFYTQLVKQNDKEQVHQQDAARSEERFRAKITAKQAHTIEGRKGQLAQ